MNGKEGRVSEVNYEIREPNNFDIRSGRIDIRTLMFEMRSGRFEERNGKLELRSGRIEKRSVKLSVNNSQLFYIQGRQ